MIRAFSLFFIVVVFLLTAGEAISQTKRDQRRARDLIEAAEVSIQQKNYQAAVDNFAAALQADPQNADAHYRKGAVHAYLKQDDQALAEFNLALQKGFKRPLDVYLFRWRIHLQKKNFDAAQSDIQKGLQIDPNNRELGLATADLAYERGDYRAALDVYQKFLPTANNRGDIYFKVASIHGKLGDHALMVTAAQNAIGSGTQNIFESYVSMATGLRRLKRFDEAIEAYQRAITAKPGSYNLYREIAEVYRSQGKFSDAVAVTRRAISELNRKIAEMQRDTTSQQQTLTELKKVLGELYADASWFYSLDGRAADAVSAALAAIQMSPELAVAYTNLCRAYNDQGKYLMAITQCNNALKYKPDDGETNFYLGRAYAANGKQADAARAFSRAVVGLEKFVSDNPEFPEGYYLLGNAYYENNQIDKAIAAYTRCLELGPRFVRARFNLGIAQTVKKNKAAALEQYNSLLSLDAGLAAKLKVEIDKL